MKQLLGESLVLAAAGGAGGLLVAVWLVEAVRGLALVAVATLSGVFPARRAANTDPVESLRSE